MPDNNDKVGEAHHFCGCTALKGRENDSEYEVRTAEEGRRRGENART